MRRELLQMSHVSLKRNGEVFLDNLNFHMFAGEIMGLIGSNNKGEDEMVRLICHNGTINFGAVWFDGRVVNSYSYSDGSDNRVAVIEQESHLVEALSVVDNLFVLRKGFRKYFISERVLKEQAVQFLREQGIEVDIQKRVEALTALERCQVEIGKAVLGGCRLIIVDNPGNFLSQYELLEFQKILKKLRTGGLSILYIGNHHQEVFRVADRTSLYADGRIEKVFENNEMTDQAIAPYIPDWKLQKPKVDPESEDGVMHFHTVRAGSLKGLRFVLHKGECLTLLDVDNEIAGDIQDLMTGKMECARGRITVEHEPYTPERARNYLDAKVALVPKDGVRKLLFWDRSYMENLTFLLDRKLKRSLIPGKIFRSIRMEYEPIVGPAIDETNISNLSLAEQNVLLYCKMQLLRPKVLVCIQPLAKGDMYTRRKILEILRWIADQGTAVLIVTTNISDTLDISDRLLVVEKGTCAAAFGKNEFNRIVW